MSKHLLSARNRSALKETRHILKIVRAARQRSVILPLKAHEVIEGLARKAEKTAKAVLQLAPKGYPEDGLILARSLAGLAIDLSYLSANDMERFKTYVAVGLNARRRMAQQCGQPVPDEPAIDWEDVKLRVQQWKSDGVYGRAQKSNCHLLFDYAYRHGSSFEHSDAWSLMTYERQNAWAREPILNITLLVTSYAAIAVHAAWSRFFSVEDPVTDAALERHFRIAFPGHALEANQDAGPAASG